MEGTGPFPCIFSMPDPVSLDCVNAGCGVRFIVSISCFPGAVPRSNFFSICATVTSSGASATLQLANRLSRTSRSLVSDVSVAGLDRRRVVRQWFDGGGPIHGRGPQQESHPTAQVSITTALPEGGGAIEVLEVRRLSVYGSAVQCSSAWPATDKARTTAGL